MDRYSYSFQSVLRFDAAVGRHFFKLRCVPCVNSCQRILSKTLSLHPAVCLTEGMDALGNGIQYGHTLAEHDAFVFCSYGVVALADYRLAEDVHADLGRFTAFHEVTRLQIHTGLRRYRSPSGNASGRPTHSQTISAPDHGSLF